MNLRILYIGPDSNTCRHRADALRRMGATVVTLDPHKFVPGNRLADFWVWKTGSLFLGGYIARRVLSQANDGPFNLVWVDSGELVTPSLLRQLRQRFACPIVNLNVDDPYGPRDGARWRLYLKSVPEYDLVVVFREPNVAEAYARGARQAFRAYLAADELAHAPRQLTSEERLKWQSDVLFVGTWMPERGPFFARLVELGIPLTIYGNRWQRAPEWPKLRNHWRGPGLHGQNDYACAISAAKICIGLVSKGNRDLSTQRSFEIPSLARPLCAQRTSEHLALYREGEEAEFWSTAEECAQKCQLLLADPERRETLARKGRERFLRNGWTNEALVQAILNRVLARPEGVTASPEQVANSPERALESAK